MKDSLGRTAFSWLTPFIFAAVTAAQTAGADVVCEGTYEWFNGKDTLNAIPGEAPENGARAAQLYNADRGAWLGQFMGKPKSEGLHEVEVSQCGRQFVLSQGSKKMLFLQSILDDTLYVAQDIGTNEAELTLRVVDHRIMVGSVKGKSHGFAFNIPVAMEPRDVSMPDMKGCYDDPAPTGKETVGDRLTVDPALRSEVIDIVADRLDVPRAEASHYIASQRTVARTRSSQKYPTILAPGEGDCPAEFEGVRDCLRYPPDTTTIVETNVLLDAQGKLLPATTEGSATGRLRVDDPGARNVCAESPTYPPADKRLRFKFFAIEADGINDVQAVLVDARTNHAKKAYYVDGKHKGMRGRAEGADEAYQGVGAPVTGRHELP